MGLLEEVLDLCEGDIMQCAPDTRGHCELVSNPFLENNLNSDIPISCVIFPKIVTSPIELSHSA